jgi:hypothetical protein
MSSTTVNNSGTVNSNHVQTSTCTSSDYQGSTATLSGAFSAGSVSSSGSLQAGASTLGQTTTGDLTCQTLSAQSTSVTSLTCSGVADFVQNVSIAGNLTVSGTTTQVNSEQTVVKDNMMALNSGNGSAKDSGIFISRDPTDKVLVVGTIYENLSMRFNTAPQGDTFIMESLPQPDLTGFLCTLEAAGFPTLTRTVTLSEPSGSSFIVHLDGVNGSEYPAASTVVTFKTPDYSIQESGDAVVMFKESSDEFVLGYTSDAADASNLTVTQYANCRFEVGNCRSLYATESLQQTSDARLKSDVKDLDSRSVDFVRDLKPKSYVIDGKAQSGFLAQVVEDQATQSSLNPSMFVTQRKTERFEDERSMNYIGLIPHLVAYCQHLEKRIEELKQ